MSSSQNNTALHTLPDDLSQVHRYVINSDACNASLSYLVGIVLCSDGNTSQETRQTIRPIKYYSVRLEDFCKNLSILLKECLAALISILKELPQIRLLPPSCQKVIIVDSAPLFGIFVQPSKKWVFRQILCSSCFDATLVFLGSINSPVSMKFKCCFYPQN